MKVTPWDGEPISIPGWYSGIPIERYHSKNMCVAESISSTNLRTCWEDSPAHMYDQWSENPKGEPRKVTEWMLRGAVAHHLLLGEDSFKTKFVAFPDEYPAAKGEMRPWNNNAHWCRSWVRAQADLGRTPVKQSMLGDVLEMAKSLVKEPLVQANLLDGYVETSGFFVHQETGLWIKVRPDVVPVGPDFVDLKITNRVTTPAIVSSIGTFGYHQQGALIWEACEALGDHFESFIMAFVESGRPYCTRTLQIPKEDLGRGRRQNAKMLRLIRACMIIDHWPGPGEMDGDFRDLGLSKDARERIDNRLREADY